MNDNFAGSVRAADDALDSRQRSDSNVYAAERLMPFFRDDGYNYRRGRNRLALAYQLELQQVVLRRSNLYLAGLGCPRGVWKHLDQARRGGSREHHWSSSVGLGSRAHVGGASWLKPHRYIRERTASLSKHLDHHASRCI